MAAHRRPRRGGGRRRLHRQLRQRVGLRGRRGAGAGRHRQPGRWPDRTTRRSGAGPTCRSTRSSTPTATSTTSSGWRRSRTRRAPPGGRGPGCVAHELVPARFDRYRLTAGYNGVINARQFKMPGVPVADRVPLPRRDLRAAPRRRRRRRAVRAPPRQGRDRRPHVGLAARPQGAVHRRPVHLGVAQLRQPAEGAALPPRVGGRPARDGRARARAAAAGPRLADRRGRPGPAGARRHRRPARPPGRRRRWPS